MHLTVEEVEAFGRLQRALVRALRDTIPGVQKVYSIMFAESENCPHVHVHVVARTADHPVSFRGPRIFDFDRPSVPRVAMERIATELREHLHARGVSL